jgi:Thioester domain
VARLLNSYFPNTNEPATLINPNQKAAAVQSAIWYFGDSYVLSATDPLRNDVAAIVAAVIAAAPSSSRPHRHSPSRRRPRAARPDPPSVRSR